ncbi:ThiF family adenylyltransferase [Bacillus changyiensis]|uniref:ThiF family adenylyltransferase n=1 Tax=Bacillus changyiensis TaxID=3004103 RepID=UPI0022E97070|nr:ThiF family adenylyltransferase [Bacillus changyiensis]MDA1475891.1 ThiF family adenylyltransferase [Bacillus changyiensis]
MNDRYSRQERFRPIGPEGQIKLQRAHVLVVGAGALGSASAEMLVRAGVGSLTIVDRDYVEASNLQRQQLYTEDDVNDHLPKAAAAEKRLRHINHSVEVKGIVTDVTAEKILDLAEGSSLIIDAVDNFETRLIVNDAAVKLGIPFLYGACVASYGITYTVIPKKTPCLHCLLGHFSMNDLTCDTSGIISPVVQQVSALQVTDALKLLTGHEMTGMIRSFDLWTNERAEIHADLLKDQACPTCVAQTFPFLSIQNETKAAVLCGRETVQIRAAGEKPPALKELATRFRKAGLHVVGNPYLVSCKLEDCKLVIFRDGRAFIHGLNDVNKAKTIYHKWIGRSAKHENI